MTIEFRKERHSVSDLKIHLICVTKYRRKVFSDAGLKLIEEAFRSVAEKMDFRVLEFNGEADHVHSLIEYPPKFSVSQITNALKGVSSRKYGQAGLPKPSKESLWSPSYFVSSVGGAPLEVLKKYIQDQKRPDTH
ncbi:MAG: IS200/IS605 family transposase [Synechococcales cyanobacterium CRU_2_2]|nr:IS200/IS605 family transposase [Synechococcales cyanobacterium CRU_2_2]